MYNFLLIEDSESDARSFLDTVKRMNHLAKNETYNLNVAKTYNEGVERVSSNYHGVIIDIKLDGDKNGNDIIDEIFNKYRLPIAVFTGTPDVNLDQYLPNMVYIKGKDKQEDIINDLCAISNTGIFNVLSGMGIIENIMTEIYWKNLYPQMDVWKEKRDQGINTEKILLRYAISHIQEKIDNEMPAYITEEMYIKPPISKDIKTGDIYKEEHKGDFYIVLSPPCDLAVHAGKIKTNQILLCQIEELDNINLKIMQQATKAIKRKDAIKNCLNNNYTDYYHWLPGNSLFSGGYINFRKVITYEPSEFKTKFGMAQLKVQDNFVKNIMNRFSSYYARQGQPDFDFKKEAELIYNRLIDKMESEAAATQE